MVELFSALAASVLIAHMLCMASTSERRWLVRIVAFVVAVFAFFVLAAIFIGASGSMLFGLMSLTVITWVGMLVKRRDLTRSTLGQALEWLVPGLLDKPGRRQAVVPTVSADDAAAPDYAPPAVSTPSPPEPTFDRPRPPAARPVPPRAFGLPAEVLFDYRDTEGRERRRRVMARKVLERNAALYLEGICTEARASRTFRMDRILGDLTHAETGELAPPSAFAWMAQPAPAEQVAPPRQVARRATYQTAVFFAGFSEKRRNELSDLAEGADMQVRATITKTVNYVVAGSMFGERQRDQAEALGIPVIDEDTFRAMT